MDTYNIIVRGWIVICCILIIVFCFCHLMICRSEIACRMQIKINKAIYKYRCDCIKTNKIPKVDYDDEEAYEKTMWRLWDFGYKNILPKEKYEIIKEFIEDKSE